MKVSGVRYEVTAQQRHRRHRVKRDRPSWAEEHEHDYSISAPVRIQHIPCVSERAFDMSHPAAITIFCLCAAWCRTCDAYADVFETLSARWPGRARWVWVDVEDQADLLGEVDVENFPSLLVSDAQQVYFYGPVLPHLDVAVRLVERVLAGDVTAPPAGELNALNQRLLAAHPA